MHGVVTIQSVCTSYMVDVHYVNHNYIHACMAQACLQWIMHNLMTGNPRVGSGVPVTSIAGAAGNGAMMMMMMAGMTLKAISIVHNAGGITGGGSNGITRGLNYVVADEVMHVLLDCIIGAHVYYLYYL